MPALSIKRQAFLYGLVTFGLWMFYVAVQEFNFLEATTETSSRSKITENISSDEAVAASSVSAPEPLWPTSNGIRKWGCGLTETPFIFVHIGKAGGGGVRARVAASALNYTRANWAPAFTTVFDESYYPVRRVENGQNITYRATFCNSAYRNHRQASTFKQFEGVLPCTAITPIGQALACPEPMRKRWEGHPCPSDPSRMESAHVVYTGHNFFGSEIHWLPAPYLDQWWQTYWASADAETAADLTIEGLSLPWKTLDVSVDKDDVVPAETTIGSLWNTLDGAHAWCNENLVRPILPSRSKNQQSHLECGQTMESKLDDVAVQAMSHHRPMETPAQRGRAWSDLYASLPVVRVTVLRDPFSWLVSKFFWHSLHKKANLTCDDVVNATYGSGHPDVYLGAINKTVIPLIDSPGSGWARRMSIGYMEYLCGEDCITRFERNGHFDLEELEAQAEYNLRNAFAVVGLLEETDVFYDMVTARVDYMNMSLNPHVVGKKHGSGGREEGRRCKERFKDPQLQAELIAASPEIAALVRLYKVGVEVNQFQRKELQECSGIGI